MQSLPHNTVKEFLYYSSLNILQSNGGDWCRLWQQLPDTLAQCTKSYMTSGSGKRSRKMCKYTPLSHFPQQNLQRFFQVILNKGLYITVHHVHNIGIFKACAVVLD